jgi:hypothetical protein
MTLPMHSPPSETIIQVASPSRPAPPSSARPAAAPVAPVVASAAPPVSEPLDASDTEMELEGVELLHYPPLPMLATPSPLTPPLAPVAAPDSRPILRPAVASPIASASATSSARRMAPASAPAALATAHLGIEESEFDKPTYLRRAMAGEGLRMPGEKG